MKHVVLNIFTITKLAKCKQFQLVSLKITPCNMEHFILKTHTRSQKNPYQGSRIHSQISENLKNIKKNFFFSENKAAYEISERKYFIFNIWELYMIIGEL